MWDKNPCDACAGHMRAGIILISVRNGENGDNPYRTGGWCVVTEDFMRRGWLHPESLVESICAARVAFVPDDSWDKIGLPRGEQK